MSRFKEQLLELGTYETSFPDGQLVFRVPLKSLQESTKSERPLVEGEWTASLEMSDGSVVQTATGGSGEHAMEFLACALRQRGKTA